MDLLKIMSKKNNRLVLELLSKYDKLYYSAIKKELKIYDKLLNNSLDELVSAGLVKKEVENPEVRTSKVYYSLTDFGKKAVKLYDYAEQLEKELEEKHSIIINGSVGDNNIIANNIQNSNISFKK
ncbi:winged helix-turn-helix transcriptional regulator [Methanothermococcus thermolithotrophicus]|uniref:winged helix-turn-helix transcriptional regulator n=1 Tax=Methanothermococcus thermolithotrophicus TaxID=2186 RepID=UPI00037E1B65|nr:winged helix-turn-helix transcriptional regulator [Methanothermococcus thermolithotrophicus]